MEQMVSVVVLDVDDLTLSHLSQFLCHHGWPDTVIVSAMDFVRLCALASITGGTIHQDVLWLLGTQWQRGAGAIRQLNWEQEELRCIERRDHG